jgi:hypothetical protein
MSTVESEVARPATLIGLGSRNVGSTTAFAAVAVSRLASDCGNSLGAVAVGATASTTARGASITVD